ncbi:DUF4123 domain-containing protein [Vibrio sp. JC009]|uniref:DUF4123 domain-containing protein n=1 Tax=Vibrio sp. JC009 TaxID=2912314 RepID=UPI0023AF1BFF|nr:DUF4123 domain-containing protein [Vibrio sp. JC009]WED22866.1 DUF4123 domain-containing protein [Vibrio sp. JC009]
MQIEHNYIVIAEPQRVEDLARRLSEGEVPYTFLLKGTMYAGCQTQGPYLFPANKVPEALLDKICQSRGGIILDTPLRLSELQALLRQQIYAENPQCGRSYIRFYAPHIARALMEQKSFCFPSVRAVHIPDYLSQSWEIHTLPEVQISPSWCLTSDLCQRIRVHHYAYWLGTLSTWPLPGDSILSAAELLYQWTCEDKSLTQITLARCAHWLAEYYQYLPNEEFRLCFQGTESINQKKQIAMQWIKQYRVQQQEPSYAI